MENTKQRYSALPIIMMLALFAMIAFVTNLCSPMATIIKAQGDISNVLSQIGNYGNYGAYLIMGLPAGLCIKKFGYKKTVLIGLVIGIAGIGLQICSGLFDVKENLGLVFGVYLAGALISGACMCMLNTVVNPMLNLLGGGGAKGNQLIQIGGVFNSAAAVAVYIIMGALIGEAAKAKISDATPALYIALAIFVLAFIVIFFTKIEEPDKEENTNSQLELVKGALRYRHFVFGILAICFYGAVEVGPPTYIIQYLTTSTDAATPGLAMDAGYCGTLSAIYFLMMFAGRLLGGIVGGKIAPKTMIASVSTVSIILLLAGILIPTTTTITFPGVNFVEMALVWGEIPVGIFLFLLVGLCASVMWGGIFNLAVEGLGKYTAIASGLFMSMVCGFAVMLAIQGLIADITGSFLISFLVPAVCAAYILWYALIGSKNVNKDIVTE